MNGPDFRVLSGNMVPRARFTALLLLLLINNSVSFNVDYSAVERSWQAARDANSQRAQQLVQQSHAKVQETVTSVCENWVQPPKEDRECDCPSEVASSTGAPGPLQEDSQEAEQLGVASYFTLWAFMMWTVAVFALGCGFGQLTAPPPDTAAAAVGPSRSTRTQQPGKRPGKGYVDSKIHRAVDSGREANVPIACLAPGLGNSSSCSSSSSRSQKQPTSPWQRAELFDGGSAVLDDILYSSDEAPCREPAAAAEVSAPLPEASWCCPRGGVAGDEEPGQCLHLETPPGSMFEGTKQRGGGRDSAAAAALQAPKESCASGGCLGNVAGHGLHLPAQSSNQHLAACAGFTEVLETQEACCSITGHQSAAAAPPSDADSRARDTDGHIGPAYPSGGHQATGQPHLPPESGQLPRTPERNGRPLRRAAGDEPPASHRQRNVQQEIVEEFVSNVIGDRSSCTPSQRRRTPSHGGQQQQDLLEGFIKCSHAIVAASPLKSGSPVKIVNNVQIVNNVHVPRNFGEQMFSAITNLVAPLHDKLDEIGSSFGRVETRFDSMARDAAIKNQQRNFSRVATLSLRVMLAVIVVMALRSGRVWEVWRTCSEQIRPGRLAAWFFGPLSFLQQVWRRSVCMFSEGSLYALGCGVVLKFIIPNVLFATGSSEAIMWEIDVALFQGVFQAYIGAHVMHCLGAGYCTWLLLWWAWCGCQLLMCTCVVESKIRRLYVYGLLVACALLAGYLPFHPSGVAFHHSLLRHVPFATSVSNQFSIHGIIQKWFKL